MLVASKLSDAELLAIIDAGDLAMAASDSAGETDCFSTESPERKRLREAIQALTADQLHELHAIFWIGRGDGVHGPADFAELVEHSRKDSGDDGLYLVSKYELSTHLRVGVRKLGRTLNRDNI